MFTDAKKFNKEIKALRAVNFGPALHPLKKEQIKQAVLSRLVFVDKFSPAQEQRKLKFIRLAIPVSLGLLMLGGTAFASNNAKPGDVLFPVKKAAEQMVVRLTPTTEGKAKLLTQFAGERLRELSEINNQAKINASSSSGSLVSGQAEAEGEVKSALSELESAEASLQAKGNVAAAAAVNQTVLQLQTSLQTNQARENKGDESPKIIGDNQKATSTQDTPLHTGLEVTDKKHKGQQKSLDNENSAAPNAPDNKNSGQENGLATTTPIILGGHNQDGNKDNQGNKDNSQGNTNATPGAQSAANATSTQASTAPPAVNTNDSRASTGSQSDSNSQNNLPANVGASNNQASNNPGSASQGGGSQSSTNQGSGQGSGSGSSSGGSSGNGGSGSGSGNQNQGKPSGGSDH